MTLLLVSQLFQITQPIFIYRVNKIQDFFIFDSAGKDLFADVCEKNWDKPGMFALVFDITKASSFQNCQSWLQKIIKFFEPGKTVPGL